jgi:hypothetical protein
VNIIYGLGGNDTINGLDGDDTIFKSKMSKHYRRMRIVKKPGYCSSMAE